MSTIVDLDVVVNDNNIAVFAPPAEIQLAVDFGQQGRRGTYIWSGGSDPNLFSPTNGPWGSDLQYYDMYINGGAGESNRWLFQYQPVPGGGEWVQLIRVSPVAYDALIQTSVFTAGATSISIAISDIFAGTSITNPDAQSFLVNLSFENSTSPVSYSISSKTISGGNLIVGVQAVQYSGSAWSALSGTIPFYIHIVYSE
jgi:hypothetical protein